MTEDEKKPTRHNYYLYIDGSGDTMNQFDKRKRAPKVIAAIVAVGLFIGLCVISVWIYG